MPPPVFIMKQKAWDINLLPIVGSGKPELATDNAHAEAWASTQLLCGF